jgi:predicted nucleotidyltransferase
VSKKSLPSRAQYLSPEQIEEAVKEVSRLARQQGIHLALIGGYALQLYGSRRLTADVDFCADGIVSGLKAGPRLSFGGQQVIASNGVVVDLIMRSDDYEALYEDALQRSRPMTGVKAPVASLEHLLAMKLQAGRGKDLADLEYIISQDFLNVTKARKLVRDFVGGAYAVRDLDSLLLEAEVMNAQLKRNRRRR